MRTEFSSNRPMSTNNKCHKADRHCSEASEEGAWLAEVTRKGWHLSCPGKNHLVAKVWWGEFCRRQQSIQQ